MVKDEWFILEASDARYQRVPYRLHIYNILAHDHFDFCKIKVRSLSEVHVKLLRTHITSTFVMSERQLKGQSYYACEALYTCLTMKYIVG